MKGYRKTALFCAAVMAASALAGCGGGSAGKGSAVKVNGDAVYPVECEDTITYWMPLDSRLEGKVENLGETPLAKELEKRTGVKVEYVHPQAGQSAEQFNIMLASDELTDIVTYNWLGYGGGPDKTIEDGYIYKLNDIFDKYAPALKKYLANNSDADKQIKSDAGSYYVFPFITGEKWMSTCQGLILRKDWLDKLGLSEPKTLDELENVLREFKKLSKQAPLVLNTSQLNMVLYAYDTMADFYVQDGKIVYGYATENYRKGVERLASWVQEGLLDSNFISADNKYIQSRILNGDAGAYFGLVVSGLGALLDAKPADQPDFDLVAVRQPTLTGAKPEFSYDALPILPGYCAAISTNCKNPELAARFLDYGYTDEGHMLYNFGIEGESYDMVDGKPVISDLIKHNPDGLTFAQAAVFYMRSPYSGIFVQDPDYIRQSLTYPEQQQHAYDVWSDTNMSEHLLPPITLKPEEQAESADIMSNIATYASEKLVSFVSGKESMDNFDSYLQQLETYGLADAIKVRQDALDRYNKR